MNLPRPTRHLAALLVLGALLAVPAMPSTADAMHLDDVFALLREGVSEETILAQLDAKRVTFDLSTQDILALKQAGASEALIRRMIRGAEEPYTVIEESYDAPSSVDVEIRTDVYDPFGYHWYWQPTYFTYYYPFRWVDCGFYWSGYWRNDWCGWNPRVVHCWDWYHWDGPGYGHGGRDRVRSGRDAWTRDRSTPRYDTTKWTDRSEPTRRQADRPPRRRQVTRDPNHGDAPPATPPPSRESRGRSSWGRTRDADRPPTTAPDRSGDRGSRSRPSRSDGRSTRS